MTALDPAPRHDELDMLEIADPELRASAAAAPSYSDRHLHLLRLTLDLHVDAMLHALGAAGAGLPVDLPWDRWLSEDLAAIRRLTAALVEQGTTPPAALGADLVGADPDRVIADLLARFTSAHDMVDGLARRPDGLPAATRPAVREVQHRMAQRVAELQQAAGSAPLRGQPAPSRTRRIDLAAAEREDGALPGPGHRFLPGEMLG